MKKLKKWGAVLISCVLAAEMCSTISTDAATLQLECNASQNYTLVEDDNGYFTKYYDAVFEPDSGTGEMMVTDYLYLNYVIFTVTDMNAFSAIYEDYAAQLDFDVVNCTDDQYYMYDIIENGTLPEDKQDLTRQMSIELYENGAISAAIYRNSSGFESPADLAPFTISGLTADDLDALNNCPNLWLRNCIWRRFDAVS
ncbi:MAG: hypothetical protein LIO74_11370 [Ruminococcus sp.]|nr:hypothetical protein [Ruminococcus sp.]